MNPAGRICVVTAAFPAPSDPVRAIFLRNFLAGFRRRGVELTVVAPRIDPGDPPVETFEPGFDVERFSYGAGGKRLKELGDRVPPWTLARYLVAAATRTRRVVRRRNARPAVIYAHWLLPAGVVGALVSRITGVPLVVHAHGSDVTRYAFSSRLATRVARWTLRRASLVLAVSRDLANRLTGPLGVPPERVRVVPMGVDPRAFGENDASGGGALDLPHRDGRLEVLYVGDLDSHKGIVPLARAIAESDAIRERVRLHVAGDGVLRPELEELRTRAGQRESIVVHGRVAQSDVARLCRHADVLVLPSLGEGAPLVVMEALATGLPVLATPVGGIPELVRDGETGWLAPAPDIPTRLLELADDREMVARARRAIEDAELDLSADARASEAMAYIAELVDGSSA